MQVDRRWRLRGGGSESRMKKFQTYGRHGVIVCVMWLGGCAATSAGPGARVTITDILTRQAAAWNAGDIETFMQPYDRSQSLTFSSGGKVTRGWQSTLDGYRKRYPTCESMGCLTFSDLEITELGHRAALVLGSWHLDREQPIGGTFTLVFTKKGDRWRIIHDHTSRDGA